MMTGTIVTFVERKGLEYEAVIVRSEEDRAEIKWDSPDASGRFRGKQGTHPFFREGMTARYIKLPDVADEGMTAWKNLTNKP